MPLRNDRRRRVLADDLLHHSASELLGNGDEPLPAASGMRYATAARRENQPRIVDFVPLRVWPFSLIVGMGVLMIAGLLAAFAWLPALEQFIPADALAPLNLHAEHNLATWLASLILLSNMQLALLVYSVRRHRVDDYKSRYRIWLAVAMASLVVSVDLATGVRQLLKVALAPVARYCGVAEHYGMWAVLGIAATYLTVRLILETRRSPGSLFTFLLASSVFCAPQLLPSRLLSFEAPTHAVLFEMGTFLSGCLLLLTGTLVFARNVLLDIEGKLPVRKARPAKPARVRKVKAAKSPTEDEAGTSKQTATKVKTSTTIRTDLDPPAKPAPAPKPTFVPSKPVSQPVARRDDDDNDEEDADAPTDLRNLSRTERKRLKREAKLARRAA